ncbi:MAG: site-specific integrase [Acidobacteria bacterium]|nr:site-specific integrase [Acidobacteriota bacterium]
MRSWLEHKRHEVRWQTWRRYEQLFRTHIEPNLGSVRLSRLRPNQLRDLYSSKLAEGLAVETVRHLHKVIRAALNQAEREDLVVKNVCRQVRPPRKQRYEINPLSPDEARRLRKTLRGHPDEALYVLALSTGMRQGEILGLRWRDCDLDSGYISVNRSLVFIRNDWALEEPKTKSSRRRIHLALDAIETLRTHLLSQLEKRLALGAAWQDNDLVFPTGIGTAKRGRSLVTRSFRPLLEAAGLRRIRFHDLRHTFASLLLQNGESLPYVRDQLGHSSIKLTVDIYGHLEPGANREAVNRLPSLEDPVFSAEEQENVATK